MTPERRRRHSAPSPSCKDGIKSWQTKVGATTEPSSARLGSFHISCHGCACPRNGGLLPVSLLFPHPRDRWDCASLALPLFSCCFVAACDFAFLAILAIRISGSLLLFTLSQDHSFDKPCRLRILCAALVAPVLIRKSLQPALVSAAALQPGLSQFVSADRDRCAAWNWSRCCLPLNVSIAVLRRAGF
jgi:hypothetical protein